jgi:hypothetical protein
MAYINSESDLKFSVSITSAGVADNNLNATVSGYSAAIGNNNPAIVGVIPKFSYSENLTVSEFTLGVQIPTNLVTNTVGTYAADNDEFAGIKRLNFFRFFDEINTLLPVETTFDISSNMMYTNTGDLGTYCVMDMEIWLESLTEGMDETNEDGTSDESPANDTPDNQGGSLSENMGMTASTFTNQRRPLYSQTTQTNKMTAVGAASSTEEYNVIFCVDTRGFEELNNQGNSTEEQDLFNGIIAQTRTKLTNSNHREKAHIYWFNEKNYFGRMNDGILTGIKNLSKADREVDDVNGELDITEMALNALNSGKHNKELKTYVFLIFNSANLNSEEDPASELSERVYEHKELYDTEIHVSIISNLETYKDTGYIIKMVNNSGGTIINTNRAYYESYYADSVVKYLRATEQPMKIISSVGLTPLSPIFDSEYIRNLNENRSPYIDTDVDGLPDYKEVDLDSGLINFADDTDFLPTIQDCVNHLAKTGKYTYVEAGYDDFLKNQEEFERRKVNGPVPLDVIMSVRILPINSDPTMEDGDEDGYKDKSDPEPLNKINNGADICSEDNIPPINATIIQKSLEHLKLLDMYENGSKADYGLFRGKTKAAYQMFQLNYGFVITGNDAIIDENTYQTIINVAVNNGLTLSEYPGKAGKDLYTAVILDDIVTGFISHSKDYFSDTYTLRPNPSEDQVKNNISVVELKNNDYFDVMYCFDYTVPLTEKLHEFADQTETYKTFNTYTLAIWFIRVFGDSAWDLKNEESWNESIPNIEYYSQKFTFCFNGMFINSEQLGNICFGYTGAKLGLSLETLFGGSAKYAELDGTEDNVDDIVFITLGWTFYSEEII